MDNVTHSLVGLAVGEGICRWREFRGETTSRLWKPFALFLSLTANNFPDLDVLYASLLGGKMGYLLHHRGHTHTVLWAIPQAALIFILGLWWSRRKNAAWNRKDSIWLGVICILGTLLHVVLDALNTYGVHPFWPWDSRWFYGDSVFIVEPLFWVILVPPLVFAVKKAVWKGLIASFFILGIALPWLTPFVPMSLAVLVTLVGIVSLAVTLKLSPLPRFWVTAALALGVVAAFLWGSRYCRKIFETEAHRLEVHDVILSPMPANLFCWTILTVETDKERDLYRLRRGVFAPFPNWFRPESCPSMRMKTSTLALTPVARTTDPHLLWWGEWTGSLRKLQELAKTHCQAKGVLKFARAPFWMPITPSEFVMGDLRYDTGKELGFSEFVFANQTSECPVAVPAWVEPRKDLLSTELSVNPTMLNFSKTPHEVVP